jgi:hypothetical protein
MKKIHRITAGFLVLILLFLPLQVGHAAGTIVSVKNYTYKGYPYIQIVKSNFKTNTDSINKVLKWHAVNNAKISADIKKEDNFHSITSKVQLYYNKDGKFSVGYDDYMYAGGAHGMYNTTIFNYDLDTGKQISLKSILNTDEKISKAKNYAVYVLNAKYKKGANLFADVINDPPFDVSKMPFYLKDSGITVRFYPYEVAPFSEGFVDITIPYSEINKK